MAARVNLRLGIMTNKNEIKKMKKLHPSWFYPVGYSCMVLIRYDGKMEKMDLTSNMLPVDYPMWLSLKSTKTVDVLNGGAY